MVDEIADDDLLIHHFSLGSRASRIGVRAARAGWCSSTTTSRRPSTSSACTISSCGSAITDAASCCAYRSRVRPRARRLGVQSPGARGARASRRRRCCPSCRTSRTSTVAPDPRVARRVRRRVDEHPVRRARRAEQAAGQSDPVLPRVQDALQPATRGCILAGSYGGFERTSRSCTRSSRGWACDDVHILGQVTNEELTALYDVADLFLCASEHEGFCVPLDRGVLQARAGRSPTRPRPCRRRWTAAACCTTRAIRGRSPR